MTYKPKIVFVGGIESGKSTTILSLWEDNIIDYCAGDGIHSFRVSEMLVGRENVEFDVIELPRINYTSTKWIEKPGIASTLESADVIVYVITCDEVSISSRKQYIDTVFSSLKLKQDVVIIIALGQADWVLTPNVARSFEVSKSKQVGLPAVASIIKKTNLIYSEFASFSDYDATFSVDSVIPYSNVLNWNIDELKYQIWNGIVLSMNNLVFDEGLPTLVLSGKTGCGKTSTINLLWDKDLATNKAVSCTKFPAVMRIQDVYNGVTVSFNLVDLPGIAESMAANAVYQKFYRKFIAKASVLVCLSQADRRAYKQDQLFYSSLIKGGILQPSQNIILGINQADLLFKSAEHLNGIDLNTIADDDRIITEKTMDYYDCVFREVFADFPRVTQDSVVIYSVLQNWHMDKLKDKIYKLL